MTFLSVSSRSLELMNSQGVLENGAVRETEGNQISTVFVYLTGLFIFGKFLKTPYGEECHLSEK